MSNPKSLELSPLVDVVVEIRFSSEVFSSAIFGLVYQEIKDLFPEVKKLPILQIPDSIREKDPNLKYKPHFQLIGDGFTCMVGPDVLSVSAKMPYPGWDKYFPIIQGTFAKVLGINVISTVSRMGIRYINFFDFNVLTKIKLDLGFFDNQLRTTVITDVEKSGFINKVQISNDAVQKKLNGSLIDIDTIKNYSDNSFKSSYIDDLNKSHGILKDFFWSLLKEEFIEELKPIY